MRISNRLGNTVPTSPSASAQTFCSAASPTVASLTPAPSTTIKWYNVATAGTALATTTALATGTYYVTAVNANGCESGRTSVAVTIATTPNISYSGVASNYCVNTSITSLTPTNTGGASTQSNIGIVSTLAGNTEGFADGTGTAAQFFYPYGLASDAAGNIYVADEFNEIIRKITPGGVVTTFAGSANVVGYADGTGAAATFNAPSGVAIDAAGNLFVADQLNSIIRKITPAAVVTTFAGTGNIAIFYNPTGVAIHAGGNVYVADRSNHRIRKITPAGMVTTFAGSSQGFVDGTGTAAQFSYPEDVATDAAGNVYVADASNNMIRKIDELALMPEVFVYDNACSVWIYFKKLRFFTLNR